MRCSSPVLPPMLSPPFTLVGPAISTHARTPSLTPVSFRSCFLCVVLFKALREEEEEEELVEALSKHLSLLRCGVSSLVSLGRYRSYGTFTQGHSCIELYRSTSLCFFLGL